MALSGLANQLQSMVDDTYIFGLWTKDLCDQLCWNPVYLSSDFSRATNQGRIAPTWSWANFDGPVDFDRAYYSTYQRYYKYWTEVAEYPIDWTKELTLRGLALKSRILWKDEGDLCGKPHYVPHLSFDRITTPYILASSSTRGTVRWDENILQEDVDPEQWSNFQKQRNSDLLFLVVRSSTCTVAEEVEGLILRMLPHSADDPVLYIRMGIFTVHDMGDHAMGHVASWSAMREYEIEDPTVADPIQTVTII